MTTCHKHFPDRRAVPASRLFARCRHGTRRLAILVAVATLSLGCHSFYPVSRATGLGGDGIVEVQFADQSAVTIVRPDGDSLAQPDLDRLRGRVLTRHADTVTMQLAKLVTRKGRFVVERRVAPGTTARIVLSPNDAVQAERVNAGRTTLLVIGVVGLSFVILVAIAASTYTYTGN